MRLIFMRQKYLRVNRNLIFISAEYQNRESARWRRQLLGDWRLVGFGIYAEGPLTGKPTRAYPDMERAAPRKERRPDRCNDDASTRLAAHRRQRDCPPWCLFQYHIYAWSQPVCATLRHFASHPLPRWPVVDRHSQRPMRRSPRLITVRLDPGGHRMGSAPSVRFSGMI